MATKALTVLGSTGSIGKNTLDVAGRFPGLYRIHALAAHSNVQALLPQIETHQPKVVAVFLPEAAEQLLEILPPNRRPAVVTGMEGLREVAAAPEVEQVISGMVGAVGLLPTYAAIEAGKQVAIANKETLVLAGELMVAMAKKTGARLLPMDSEHNAIFQCLAGPGENEIERIVLTASGGPFRDLPLAGFSEITREQAMAHPNWNMGPKITIDSATMMNKGLEVIEARWLFGLPPEKIEVVIHHQSIVHSLVEFIDGSTLAQLGLPDMRTPIAYCLSYPGRLPLPLPRLDLAKVGRLDFEMVEKARYPCLALALAAMERGGGAPAALNGANETVVAAYLNDAFPFTGIAVILEQAMQQLAEVISSGLAPEFLTSIRTVDDAIAADLWGRKTAAALIPME